MIPTVARTVLYRLSEADAERVNRRRTNGSAIAAQIAADKWPMGAQAHVGNRVYTGETVPMVIVRVWPNEYGEGVPGVNGQAFLDGNDALWVTSAKEGPEPGQWSWPPRA